MLKWSNDHIDRFPAALRSARLTTSLNPQLAALEARVARELTRACDGGRLGVAYSGGVDSTVLAALATRALGPEKVVLLLAVSPSLSRREHRLALRQAELLGLELVEVPTDELSRPDYASNPVDRCFHCKDELFTRIDEEHTTRLGIAAVAYGENADDALRPDRPGAAAATAHHVLKPLASAGITKQQVREIARAFGLPSADKPAAPCLASRIPHGQPVTAEKLAQIDAAEDAVLQAGFTDCRVRHHGDLARIEIPSDELPRLTDTQLRNRLVAQVREAGFAHVTVDLDGIRSGALTLQLLSRRVP